MDLPTSGADYTKVAAVLVGGAALFVSVLQWRVARDKLKLDLYNKRFNVYVCAIDYYQAAMKDDLSEIRKTATMFVKVSRESIFLFKKEDGILPLMRKIGQDCNSITLYTEEKAKGVEADPLMLSEYVRVRQAPLLRLETLLLELETKMAPYLNFQNIQSGPVSNWFNRLIGAD
jgi:hypothetical protein